MHIVAPDRSVIKRETVRHPGAVAVVAVVVRNGVEHVALIRQYRAPIDAMLLEIPAGKLDVSGEAIDTAARRELQEEVGLVAGSLEPLIGFHTGAGFNDEFITVYVARDCTETSLSPDGPEEATAEILLVPVSDLPDAISSGRITDAKTQIGLMAFLHAPEFAQSFG